LESEVGAQLSDVNSMCSIQLFYQELRRWWTTLWTRRLPERKWSINKILSSW
jgi:hypothetical protein